MSISEKKQTLDNKICSLAMSSKDYVLAAFLRDRLRVRFIK